MNVNIEFNENIWIMKRKIGVVINSTGVIIEKVPYYLTLLLIELSDENYNISKNSSISRFLLLLNSKKSMKVL